MQNLYCRAPKECITQSHVQYQDLQLQDRKGYKRYNKRNMKKKIVSRKIKEES